MAENGPESESAQPSAPPVENGLTNHVNGSSEHKEHKSSSSSGDVKKHSSSSSSSKDRERSDKDRDRHKDDKHRSSSSSKHSSSSSKDKERSEHRSSSSKHSSSSSSKDKDRHRDDKDRKERSDKDRSDRDKERSKDRHRDDKDRKRDGERSKDKDRHRDDKDRHRSDKDRKDRPKDDRDKHRSSSSSKHSSSSSKEKSSSEAVVKEEPRTMTVKSETTQVKVENEYRLTERLSSPKKEAVMSPPRVKEEVMSPVKSESEDDQMRKPLKKRPVQSEDSDDEPLGKSKKMKKEDSDGEEYKPSSAKKVKVKKEVKPEPKAAKKRPSEAGISESKAKKAKTEIMSPTKKGGKVKKETEEPEVWKWWEEEKKDDGAKWRFLEHKGPLFAPPYERLPDNVHFYYNGKHMKLSQDAEEVAGFYAKMIEHDYCTKDVFNTNFFKDWRKVMTSSEREKITDLKKCNFKEIHAHFQRVSEDRKARSKEEKKAEKERNEEIVKEYGFCIMDGHKEKIGNFRIEPPGLFRGRGEHPKQGKLKTRVRPEDVMINCSKDSKIPKAPDGHKWKEVRHDNSVTWLCSWNENIQGAVKYIMLNASSRLKGEKDWQKYETARRLKKIVGKIRANYLEDLKSKEMRVRQRAVAMYFIDKLALRAGNEKDGDESADTVGCCSLRVEHIKLYPEKGGKENVVEFDFLGKDSIRYFNSVPVDRRVFKNVKLFMDGKNGPDDLFDRLNTSILNQHLQSLMEGLTAKVFRTYNASKTLQEQLDLLTEEGDNVAQKLLSYNRANRAVAVLCNHQRAAPKNFDKQMENLQNKIDAKNEAIKACKQEVKAAKSDYKNCHNERNKSAYERKKKQLERLEEQLTKLEVQQTDKDENKEIALGTSKLNYLDPRISVAWCKKHEVPIEKIYNKTQRDKFRWAIEMVGPEFVF